MSSIVIKKLNGGFVGGKTLDQVRKPIFRIRKSFRSGVERLYLWEEKTRFTEGLNEFGVCVFSCPCIEEKESPNYHKRSMKMSSSPVGFGIRQSLLENNVYSAIDKLISYQVDGVTVVFDSRSCMALTGEFIDGEYISQSIEVLDQYASIGASREIQDVELDRKAKILKSGLQSVKNVDDMFDLLSHSGEINHRSNILIQNTKRNEEKTTGQIVLEPKEKTLCFRPIWCQTVFDVEKLNKQHEKTFFEIKNRKRLQSFKQYIGL